MLQERVGRGTKRVVAGARLPKWLVRIGLVVAIGVLALQPLIANAAQPPVGLGTAASFAVLAGQGVTNTGPTVVNGDLGTSPNPAVTGFPPGKVHGQIHKADAVALQAQKDLTTAYNDAAGRTPVTTIATELGGKTLKPGVYKSASGTFQITGTLTLDAQGDSNAVFIFQMAATLVTASSSKVSLLGGASACSVFWQVGSSATLGTNPTFHGQHPGVDLHPGADRRNGGRPGVGPQCLGHVGQRHLQAIDVRGTDHDHVAPDHLAPDPHPVGRCRHRWWFDRRRAGCGRAGGRRCPAGGRRRGVWGPSARHAEGLIELAGST
jgi:hypothetical protein